MKYDFDTVVDRGGNRSGQHQGGRRNFRNRG